MSETLLIPNTLEELKTYLQDANDKTAFISGGTDLILDIKANGFNGRKLIDLTGIRELKYITDEDGYIKIGAGTTLAEIIVDDKVIGCAPMLSKAADCVGSTQIRNAATIGGNVANAFAGADLIPPLLALESELILMGPDSERTLPLKEFLVGNRRNALVNGEIVKEIRFNKCDSLQYFGKIGSRSRVTISKLNMAVKIEEKDRKIESVKLVFGALGKTAFHSSLIENYLIGKNMNDLDYEEMKSVFINQVDEAIPGRASRVYKRDAVVSLSKELYESIVEV